MSIPNLHCIEYGHLDFWTKTWFGEDPYFVHPKSTLHRIWPSWLLNKDMILGKPFSFVHSKFTLLCMSILTLEQILIWVLVRVLVLDMKVLDVLKYSLKKWVLDQYLYLVYSWGTWCTWVLGQLYLTPTLMYIPIYIYGLCWLYHK